MDHLQIPAEIFIGSFSVISVLTAYIWNSQNKRICEFEKEYQNCPMPEIKTSLASMQTDISWIKQKIANF